MLQNWCKKLYRSYRQRKIARWARAGKVYPGVTQGELMEAMKATKPYGVLEMMGFLRVRIFRGKNHPRYGDIEDYGLVSCKLVTTDFAEYVVDSLADSTTYPLDTFKQHQMGDDATAESNAHTDLQNAREAKVAGNQQENGAQVYQTIATITATASYTVNEHGLFNNAANATGVMLDRNLVPNAPDVVADDSVEFTYELTVNAES